MSHYKSNVRDLEFNLFEVLNVDRALANGSYGDLDRETASEILAEVARLAEGPIAESFVEADRNPTRFNPDRHEVLVPDALKKTIAATAEAGWFQLGLPEELGGSPAPAALIWAVNEMISGANAAASFFNFSAVLTRVLFEVGTGQQKQWARMGLERGWAATMVLTEPDAGSDVGATRTKAVAQPDGTWRIEGVKRFITCGDVGDTTENLFHMVLARPEGAVPGTKGLSLFYVPKWHFDPHTLELGERNGVFVTGVEDKMGIKSSPTCELTFGGADIPAIGWLVGDVHDGISQMFRVIENARMMVGTKAVGTLSTGYLNALAYAKERVQGPSLEQMRSRDAPRVPISEHAAVRHSLAMQKAYAEGLRAVYLYTAAHQDADVAELVSGADPHTAATINELLLPIVKGVGSERAYELLTKSLQTFGGAGYLQDYPIEQYVRDTLIDTLYEGTTAIQAQDFLFRKIVRDRGEAFGHVADQIERFLDVTADEGRFKEEHDLLATALTDTRSMVGLLEQHAAEAQRDPRQIHKAGLGSERLLQAVGDLLIGWRLLVQAAVALEALDRGVSGKDAQFYRGKVAVATYFVRNVLPQLTATRAVLTSMDLTIMDLAEAAF